MFDIFAWLKLSINLQNSWQLNFFWLSNQLIGSSDLNNINLYAHISVLKYSTFLVYYFSLTSVLYTLKHH